MKMDLVGIASWLKRERVSAVPCPWLSAIFIFVEEHYENYDYDLIAPRERRKVSQVLVEHGFRRAGGPVFEGR